MTDCRLLVNRCRGLADALCGGYMRCVIEQGLYAPVPVTTFTAWNQSPFAYYGRHMTGQLANTALDLLRPLRAALLLHAPKRKFTAP